MESRKNLVWFLSAKFIASAAQQIRTIAVSWQVYQLTKSPMHLGWVGLSQFLPVLLLSLPGGQVADRYSKKRIILITQFLDAIACICLWEISLQTHSSLLLIYATLALTGVTRAFAGPAHHPLLREITTHQTYPNAVGWSSASWQISVILGPAFGGFLYSIWDSPVVLYQICAGLCFLSFFLVIGLKVGKPLERKIPLNRSELFMGLKFVWDEKRILGAISMDLFAVLLGGCIALLPIYASDILKVGPQGLGILRAAPGIGATLTGLYLAMRPVKRHLGYKMFTSVMAFGFLTVGFAVSKNFLFSCVCLFLMGAFDQVSVMIRHVLVQLLTPEHMRGRVSSVNILFIGASNELGEFESGLTANLLGAVPATLLGGISTVAIVLGWKKIFPDLAKFDKIPDPV